MMQTIVNGLLTGGVYALVAVGLTMIHGVMKIVNFAQGEFLMIGMLLTWALYPLMGAGGSIYWMIIPVAILMAVLGLIAYRMVFNPMIKKGGSNFVALTFGLSYFLQYLVQLFFGADYKSIDIPGDFKTSVIKIGEVFMSKPRFIAFAFAMVFVVLVFIFLNKTDKGRAMRATAENTTVAQSLGINTRRSYELAFMIGIVFAGLSGLLLSPLYFVYPRLGGLFSTTATCCIVLGGLGNITGALLGGLIIGLVEAFTSTYMNTMLAPVAINLILLLVLVLKPNGIMGKGARKA